LAAIYRGIEAEEPLRLAGEIHIDGTLLSIVEPSPSAPPSLEPQQVTQPLRMSAQVDLLPVEIAVTPLARPATATGV
jgi:hypothetical protein